MELTVAVAIMATVFAAIMPLFAGIRNSAAARWAGLEMVQNARVLNEHLHRHLAQARRIVAVSAGTDPNGYIEFESDDGAVYRCGIGTWGYVEFGPVGQMHPLAGPVEALRFTCYDAVDLSRPTPAPSAIRLVTWEVRFQSPEALVPGRQVTGACCLRLEPTDNRGASIDSH